MTTWINTGYKGKDFHRGEGLPTLGNMQINTVVYRLISKSADDTRLFELVTEDSTVKKLYNSWNTMSFREVS